MAEACTPITDTEHCLLSSLLTAHFHRSKLPLGGEGRGTDNKSPMMSMAAIPPLFPTTFGGFSFSFFCRRRWPPVMSEGGFLGSGSIGWVIHSGMVGSGGQWPTGIVVVITHFFRRTLHHIRIPQLEGKREPRHYVHPNFEFSPFFRLKKSHNIRVFLRLLTEVGKTVHNISLLLFCPRDCTGKKRRGKEGE